MDVRPPRMEADTLPPTGEKPLLVQREFEPIVTHETGKPPQERTA